MRTKRAIKKKWEVFFIIFKKLSTAKNFHRSKSAPLKTKVLGADPADMQLMNKSNKGIRFLICVSDIFSKYAWFFILDDKIVL